MVNSVLNSDSSCRNGGISFVHALRCAQGRTANSTLKGSLEDTGEVHLLAWMKEHTEEHFDTFESPFNANLSGLFRGSF